MEERARFPEVAAKAGHYESFYIKACQPDGGRGVWIRHTVHKRPGAEPNASIWFCLFDRDADGAAGDQGDGPGRAALGARRLLDPRRRRRDRPRPRRGLGRHRGAQRRLVLHLRRRRRALQVPAGRLALQGAAAENEVPRALPRRPLRGPPRDRRRTVRAERLAGDDRPQLGDRARRALGLARGHRLPRCARHLLRRRRRPRPPRLPDQPLDPLRDAGPRRRARTGSAASARSARPRIDEQPTVCSFTLPGKDVVVHGRVSAPEKDFVGWVYADPKGPEHNTVNCSVADLELTVERPGLPPRELTLPGGGAYELGMQETDHGIPIQPYPDG